MPDYTTSRLYQQSFLAPRTDASSDEQEYFRGRLDAMRARAIPLVARILRDMPHYTVHDITHLDALWETASLVAEESLTLNPPEAFVFGGAVLLHDAAMTLAAYPGGIAEVRTLPEWNDFAALQHSDGGTNDGVVLVNVLRALHARSAERLATLGWPNSIAGAVGYQYLIEENDLRQFYGATIGVIAHSHWWPVSKVERDLYRYLGAMPPITGNDVDLLKVAALLRVADATHLDRRRAPPFVRALDRPQGVSELHWQYQGRLSFPRLRGDALQYSAGEPCPIEEVDSWWLGYDAFVLADQELHDTDLMLREAGRSGLRARRVHGASRPSELAADVPVTGWKPVDTRLHVSDVPRIVETLGGSRLYGSDWWAPLRELLQNSVDAIDARRRLQQKPDWGCITVDVVERPDGVWLIVEDEGVGMSERVLTTSLLDFGSSFWRSSRLAEEFPGLAATGMQPIGRFGVGFFSIFMLGEEVRVVTRRYDAAATSAMRLWFRKGLASRPILSPALVAEAPMHGGTRVEVKLRGDPRDHRTFAFITERDQKRDNLFFSSREDVTVSSLSELIAYLAPASEVTIGVGVDARTATTVVTAGDWRTITPEALARRVSRTPRTASGTLDKLMRPIVQDDGAMVGRAALSPSHGTFDRPGVLTSGGFRIQAIPHLLGVLTGEAETAARDAGTSVVGGKALKVWANSQGAYLRRSKVNEGIKALSAEVILECGGQIGSLPIVSRENSWYDAGSFASLISTMDEISLYVGNIYYEEDDAVAESTFDDEFEVDDALFVVPTLRERVITRGGPYSNRRLSHLHAMLEAIIRKTWKAVTDYDIDDVVGHVNYIDIVRSITVYRRA